MSYLSGGFLAHLCQPHADGAVTDPKLGGDVPKACALGLHAEYAVTVDDASWTAKLFATSTGVL